MKLIVLQILILFLWSCGSEQNRSQLQIDNGIELNTKRNSAPAVFYITSRVSQGMGACTAQAVSTNTVLTAAHCVTDGGIIYIENAPTETNSKFSGLSSEFVIQSPLYKRGTYAGDVAVVVFQYNIFDEFFMVRDESAQPEKGELVHFVGYSGGTKRWGSNKISGFSEDENIFTDYNKSKDSVAVSPGDSGGLLTDEHCNIIGIASRRSKTIGTNIIQSMHARPNYISNLEWIKGLRADFGSYVCGINGMDPEYCPIEGLYFPQLELLEDENEFACASLNTEVK